MFHSRMLPHCFWFASPGDKNRPQTVTCCVCNNEQKGTKGISHYFHETPTATKVTYCFHRKCLPDINQLFTCRHEGCGQRVREHNFAQRFYVDLNIYFLPAFFFLVTDIYTGVSNPSWRLPAGCYTAYVVAFFCIMEGKNLEVLMPPRLQNAIAFFLFSHYLSRDPKKSISTILLGVSVGTCTSGILNQTINRFFAGEGLRKIKTYGTRLMGRVLSLAQRVLTGFTISTLVPMLLRATPLSLEEGQFFSSDLFVACIFPFASMPAIERNAATVHWKKLPKAIRGKSAKSCPVWEIPGYFPSNVYKNKMRQCALIFLIIDFLGYFFLFSGNKMEAQPNITKEISETSQNAACLVMAVWIAMSISCFYTPFLEKKAE